MASRALIAFSFVIVFSALVDVYIWVVLKRAPNKSIYQRIKWAVPITTLLFFFGFIYSTLRINFGQHNASYLLNLLAGISFGALLAKILMVLVFLGEDIFRAFMWLYRKCFRRHRENDFMPERRKFVKTMALALGSIPFMGSLYAVTRGKYNFQTKRINLFFNDLPEEFDGIKVAHFSDFHAGTFDSLHEVERGLKIIQDEKPDIIVFTGDFVNNHASELEPYLPFLKNLKAPLGKYSILGNHDYGDYMPFSDEKMKVDNLVRLEKYQEQCGFKLLKNQAIPLGDKNDFFIVGVENWGNPPFQQYGDLRAATQEIPEQAFCILLSHDPDHWERETLGFHKKMHLTLSGHTHGAQFGVDIPGWKWSPVKYRYKRWLGLYTEQEKHLYVSKGFGFLGFPGRIGMSPEIVFFQLKRNE